MQLRTYSVADKISYHRVTASFDIRLAPRGRYPPAGCRETGLLRFPKQAFFGRIQKGLGLFADFPAGEGPGVVAMEAFITGADVDSDDVAFLSIMLLEGMPWMTTLFTEIHALAGNPLYLKKLGTAPIFSIYWRTILSISQVETPGSTASPASSVLFARFSRPPASGKLPARFQHDHVKSSRASKTRWVVSSTFSLAVRRHKQLALLAVILLEGVPSECGTPSRRSFTVSGWSSLR